CSWCGGPFNSGNYRHCTKTDSRSDTGVAFQAEFAKLQQNFERFMAQLSCSYCDGLFNGGNCLSCSIVGAGNEFVHDPNPFLTIIHSTYMTNHHNTTLRHTRASYVETILTMVMIVHHVTPVLPTVEPEDSLIMGDEDICTVPEKESNEFIKSSVEDLVPIPRESEDTSDSDKECDFPFCNHFMTFSNPMFDLNDDFTFSDDEPLSDKDVPEDNVKIYSNPLFKFDDEYISITPLSDANEDECFDPGGDVDKINAFDILLYFEDGCYESNGDVLYLDSLLSDDTTPISLPRIAPDYEDSRARCFVHRSLEL
nr:hypothetical protein [Tanacetum cinerariifolium]